MTDDRVELKNCPIDAGKAEWREHPIRGTFSSGMEAPDLSIRCTACGLETTRESTEKWERGKGTYSIREEAQAKLLARWNTRTEVTEAAAMLKAAVDALEEARSTIILMATVGYDPSRQERGIRAATKIDNTLASVKQGGV